MIQARAVKIKEPGEPEVLVIGDHELEPPGPDDVLVRVAAAGLNRADTLQRRGRYPAPPSAPADVPGLEFAGTVEAVGARVVDRKVGDPVMGIVAGGGMSTHVVTRARETLRVPEGMSLTDAAAIPEVYLTAFDALFARGHLRMGETVLVHAIASGVGTAALQLANMNGARVIGTSRSPDKLERCAELGLLHPVLSEANEFADKVRAIAPNGADVILDVVGAAYLDQNLDSIATLGRLVVVGLMGGRAGEIQLGKLLRRRVTMTGTVLRARPPEQKAELTQRFAAQAMPGFQSGALRPVIHEVMKMSEIVEAHRAMEANATFGKIVLTWD